MIAKVVGYNLPQGLPGPTQVIVDRAPTLDRHSPDRGAKFLLAKFCCVSLLLGREYFELSHV
jgi:hypothetical protein